MSFKDPTIKPCLCLHAHPDASKATWVCDAQRPSCLGSGPSFVSFVLVSDSKDMSAYAKNVFQQFAVLVERSWLNLLRNPGIVWIRLFMYTYVGSRNRLTTLKLELGVHVMLLDFLLFGRMLSLMIGLMYLDMVRCRWRVTEHWAVHCDKARLTCFSCGLPLQGDSYSTINDRISFLFYVAAFMVFMAIAVLPFCTCSTTSGSQ